MNSLRIDSFGLFTDLQNHLGMFVSQKNCIAANLIQLEMPIYFKTFYSCYLKQFCNIITTTTITYKKSFIRDTKIQMVVNLKCGRFLTSVTERQIKRLNWSDL